MGSFAAFLKRSGVHVTGSDENVYPPMSDVLKALDIPIFSPYSAENFSKLGSKPDVVVIGNVIRADNPEAKAAETLGLLRTSLPEFMEKNLLQTTRNVVVAGTHGKTTTSSMAAHVLAQCGQRPSYFIGGVSHDLPQSFHVETGGKYFVLEGDEYDTVFWDKVPKFNHYCPDDVILTSVEYDHADIYADLAAVELAFLGLIDRIRPGGRLVACTDFPSVHKCIRRAVERGIPVITYGLKALPFQHPHFGLSHLPSSVQLQVPGDYNRLNALAVWLVTERLGIASQDVARALSTFKGVKRRQEVRGEPRGITVIDDFAHHPTAVKVTLEALRRKYAGRRLLAVFEPRSATSRRKVFQAQYAEAFDSADGVFIAAPHDQSRINEGDRFSSADLVRDLKARGRAADVFADVEAGVADVARQARPGDVVAILSNGGFGGFIGKLLERLK